MGLFGDFPCGLHHARPDHVRYPHEFLDQLLAWSFELFLEILSEPGIGACGRKVSDFLETSERSIIFAMEDF